VVSQWIEKRKMHKKNINKIINTVIIVLLLFGCSSNQRDLCIKLPNGDLLKCTTIKELDSLISLSYQHYQGFTGEIEDDILKKFTVLIENQASKVGRDVAGDEYIKKLKQEEIIGLKFNKIPDSIMSYTEVLEYVSKHYPQLNREKVQSNLEVGIDKEVNYINENKEIVVKVQYSKLGISGSFLVLNSVSCK
jgi:hypothetical protein